VPNNDRKDLVERARTEIMGMAKDGLAHPSSKPVIAGSVIGAFGGWALLGSWPLGLLIGLAFALWQRVK